MADNPEIMNIRLLGGFHVSRYGQMPLTFESRNTKMWDFFKYLLACYAKPVPTEKLFEILWPDGNANDPAKSVRDIVYRLRKKLASYGGEEDYILYTDGCYLWNDCVKCSIDIVEFDCLMNEAEKPGKSEDERIALYNDAISIYHGEFLGGRTADTDIWALNFANRYKRLFLQSVNSLTQLYERRLNYEHVLLLYDRVILIEPYEEALYIKQIRTLSKNGEHAMARRQYQQMKKMLSREYGMSPSKTLKEICGEVDAVNIVRGDRE